MAELARTASAPSSMARHASEGVRRPASTTTGTLACSQMTRMQAAASMPWPEPMGEPSGMTVAQPTSSRWRQRSGSGLQYGSTAKPSSTSCRAAASVPTGSGSRYLESVMTSSLTKLLPSWPSDRATSRPSRAMRTASSAVVQPAVLGRSHTLSQSMDALSISVTALSTRRTATVTTSAPEASTDRAISAAERYLPVPRKSRDEKRRPAITRSESPVAAAGAAGFATTGAARPWARAMIKALARSARIFACCGYVPSRAIASRAS
mmetsp:Transcript_11932/g.35578  ORF Transcript_11932/g.35578 Transcript_11932/m.35578 type:complete len:265 (+) Transcript_11932:164-958(+)